MGRIGAIRHIRPIGHIRLIKSVLVLLLIVTLQFTSFPGEAFAQAPSDAVSATPTPTTAADLPSAEAFSGIDTVVPSSGEDTLSSINGTPTSAGSAVVRHQSRIRKLFKKTFRANEAVTVMVDYARSEEVTTTVFNPDGQIITPKVEVVSDVEPVALKISPPRNFKPGRYRVRVRTTSGAETTQDFTWGVLAINTNKSIYLPSETAKLHLAVLDETGTMVCNADVTLVISDPSGVKNTMTTGSSNIKVNPVCEQKIATLEPDYETKYTVGGAGQYQMELTAITPNGTYTIQDSFLVQDSVPMDVERSTITRVFPPVTYPVVFNITAQQDFEGVIQESLPDNFEVTAHPELKSFDEETTVSSAESEKSILEAPIFDLGLPFKGYQALSQGFGGIHRDPYLKKKYAQYGVVGHDGVDFPLKMGTEVIAASDGKVLVARENFDYGTTIILEHAWGRSYYGHLSKLAVAEGDIVQKGDTIGLSGNTGLSTGPHLHFGIKPVVNDTGNGYFGKINPLPYLKMFREDELNPTTINVSSNNGSVRLLKWYVKMKKGESMQLGYQFKSPPESPQFYLLGPLEFRSEDIEPELARIALTAPKIQADTELVEESVASSSANETLPVVEATAPQVDVRGAIVFQEARQWQLAIDADGSGTNTVSPSTGATGDLDQTYTFTFTAAEQMDTGYIQVNVPSGWSAPQGSAGTAGYTQVTPGSGAAIADTATELTGEGAFSGGTLTEGAGVWEEDPTQLDSCSTTTTQTLAADTTNFKQGSQSVQCPNSGVTTSDAGDSFGYVYNSTQNWSNHETFGVWFRSSVAINATGILAIIFYTGTLATAATGGTFDVHTVNGGNIAANTWVFLSGSLTGVTRTAIKSWGIEAIPASGLDSKNISLDDFMVGHTNATTPTFTGSGPWTIDIRVLDLDAAETMSIVYGSGGGTSGVDNSVTPGVHTFTTKSQLSAIGTLTAITTSPTVELCVGGCGPTNDQLLRHGMWFSGGVEQPFTF